jgi:hypothetical protein
VERVQALAEAAHRRARLVLVGTLAVTAVLYLVPFLRPLAWPLRLLSTAAHELGHGLGAVSVGGRFEALRMWSDGSGVATWSALVGRLGHATIAAGGLIGPAVAAALCFLVGRRPRGARVALVAVGAGLLVVDLWVVRSLFGAVFVGALGIVLLAVGLKAPDWLAQATLVFVAVQLALSVFSRGDYLFTPVARTADGVLPSDVAQIAAALVLPYWFWGACCGLFSVLVLLLGLVVYLRSDAAPRRSLDAGRELG